MKMSWLFLVSLTLSAGAIAQEIPLHCVNGTKTMTGAGHIDSPNYGSGSYPPNLNCAWRIQAGVRQRIQMKVKYEIEECETSACTCDLLTFHNGPNISDPKMKPQQSGSTTVQCGSVSWLDFDLSWKNRVLITFTTDHDVSYNGFRVNFTFVGDENVEPTGHEIAFTALNSGSLAPVDQIVYDTVVTNYGKAYDPDKGTFQAPQEGLYLFSQTIGTSRNLPFDAGITSSQATSSSLYGTVNNMNYETTRSRSTLAALSVGASVWTYTSYPLTSYNNQQIGFTGYRAVSDTYFLVAQTYAWQAQRSVPTLVEFNDIIMDPQGMYQPVYRRFVAPVSGYYYLFVTAGSSKYSAAPCRMSINTNYYSDALNVVDRKRNGTDMANRGFLLHLNQGDYVTMTLLNSALRADDQHLQTSMGGYMARPWSDTEGWVAFMAESAKAYSSSALSFTRVEVQVGSPLDSQRKNFRVVIPGIYHLEIGFRSNLYSAPHTLCLVKNDVDLACTYRTSFHQAEATRQHTVVAELALGDLLYVRLQSYYSSEDVYWIGFLLYKI